MSDPTSSSASDRSTATTHGPIGLAYREALRLGFQRARGPGILMAVLSPFFTWLPLLLLSSVSGYALGHAVDIPFLHDPSAYGRYLFALPLLLLSDRVIATIRSVQTGYFLETGMIDEHDQPIYKGLLVKLARWHRSRRMQLVLLVLSYALVIILRTQIGYTPGSSTWENLQAGSTEGITLAGWWCILFSLPVLIFLLARAFWRALVWSWFLFKVSRLNVELTATHPDRAGGLGFLVWGQASFGLTLAAVSAILSGSFAAEVIYHHQTFDSLKYHLGVFVAIGLASLFAPLLVFSRKMSRVRYRALLDFGMLAWRHDRAFDRKWIGNAGHKAEALLGNPDCASLADLGQAYEHVSRMRVVAFNQQAFLVMVVAAVMPMLPFILTTIPFTEILKKLAVFLV